jgi:hypothetical protein
VYFKNLFNPMKLRSLLFCLSFLLVLPSFAQVDVTQLTADTKTFIFSDNKNTVKTYIYQQMEEKSACCGNDRIYLEVKIAPSGYVLSAKTLTGKNDCFKKSAIDIVKNIKWDASGFKAPKSVYFEIKPELECGDRSNAYAQIPIFNNSELDVNGVPVNYANSAGVSALEASGGAPTGVPTQPTEIADNSEAGGDEGTEGEGEEGTADATETPVVADNSGADRGNEAPTETESQAPTEETNTPPAQGSAQPQVADNASASNTPAQSELDKARKMAEMRDDRDKQNEEVDRLKEELAKMKEQEEERKKREAEEARLAEERQQREEMERRRREREEAERGRQEDRYASNDRRDDDPYGDRGRDNRDPYGDDRRGGYDDAYASDNSRPTDPPPRASSPADRAQEEKRELEQQIAEIQDRIRQADADERRRQADRERFQQDFVRLQERMLRKDEEIKQAREREELERMEQQRREAEERKREQEEMVRRAMDEIKRLQLDMERKMADLERVEKDLKQREQTKLTYEQEMTRSQTQRQAELEAQIDAIKMQYGVGGSGSNATGTMPSAPVALNIAPNDSNAIAILAQQIAQLRNDIAFLTNSVNTIQNGGATRVASSRNRTSQAPVTASSGTSADKNRSWEKIDYRNPENKDDAAYSAFGSNAGIAKANEHTNVSVPDMPELKFAGGEREMEKQIADQLQAAGVCGLVQTAYEVTVSPRGEVIAYRILTANSPTVEVQLGPILRALKFQPNPGSRLPGRAIFELKADIVCEGQDRTNIKDVPDLINP